MTINNVNNIKNTTLPSDTIKEVNIADKTSAELTTQAFEELIAGTESQNQKLEDILKILNTLSEEQIRENRMQEGALCLTSGMIIGAIGLHAATGGKFDILKTSSRLTKFIKTNTGKVLAGLVSAGGILLAMFGVKNLVKEVNNNNNYKR